MRSGPGIVEAGDGQPEPLDHHVGVAVVLDRDLDPLQDNVPAQLDDLGPERRLGRGGCRAGRVVAVAAGETAEGEHADGTRQHRARYRTGRPVGDSSGHDAYSSDTSCSRRVRKRRSGSVVTRSSASR